jgi:hypothetical protein
MKPYNMAIVAITIGSDESKTRAHQTARPIKKPENAA